MHRTKFGHARIRSRSGSLVALVALGLLAASCSSEGDADGSRLDIDYISVSQHASGTTGSQCHGAEVGTSIVVKNGGGAVVGTGRVGAGQWEDHPDGFNHDCVQRATIDLDTADFYVVSIEGLGGELTYSHDELASSGWTIAIG